MTPEEASVLAQATKPRDMFAEFLLLARMIDRNKPWLGSSSTKGWNVMSREQIMREAVNQAHKLGLKVYGGTLEAVVQQKDGSWTANPDTGAGDEAGVEVAYTYNWPDKRIRARLTEETMPEDATVPYVLEMIQVMCRHYPTLGAPK